MSGETLEAIGIHDILAALPHRYPFLLVDRIIEIRGDEHGIGIKNVTANEPQFIGHFPNNPVMPGVLVLEGMAQTAGTLCIRALPGQTKPALVYFLTIDKAKFREGVTISTGTEDHGEVTSVGDRCFLMANSHIGHDCHVGDDVTFANGAVLGGHVSVANYVFIGGNTAVHQFVRVGEGAMLGGMSGITRDVIPFGFAFGPKAMLGGLNVVGLKRRKFGRADLHSIRSAYHRLFFGDDTFAA